MSTSTVLSIVQPQFIRYSTLVIIIGSIFGNGCILILFSRHWKNACALCLVYAALFNCLNIIVNLWSKVYGSFASDSLKYIIDLCILRIYIGHTWSQIGRHMVCLAGIYRYILITNNTRFRIISRPIVIRSIIGGMIIA